MTNTKDLNPLCAHRANYHFEGETCRYAADLKRGDQVGVVSGAHAIVLRDAQPVADEPGWVSVLLDASGDGPALVPADKVLPVRPAAS
ncbi:hypothetical protein AB0C93_37955 [Streptomyces sp. NPDC048518]|uniref:hypothetical protein n=1 Tax=Streptomyces sp. NPDC048518 TaxID=3155029 RepID=UPI0033CD4352